MEQIQACLFTVLKAVTKFDFANNLNSMTILAASPAKTIIFHP
jgi:hypothetical protein